jgi:hypothetical protein
MTESSPNNFRRGLQILAIEIDFRHESGQKTLMPAWWKIRECSGSTALKKACHHH